jgi:isopentenyl phosphate kinase
MFALLCRKNDLLGIIVILHFSVIPHMDPVYVHATIQSMETELVFLKLGGSVITDKASPSTPRMEIIQRLAQEIAQARKNRPQLRLLVGHGSGSFGHMEAARHSTAGGMRTPEDWVGFSKVWRAADALNRLMMDALSDADLPVIRVAASGAALADAGALISFPVDIIQLALASGLNPVVYGDVVFDRQQGGAIASTEDIFTILVRECRPRRVLLAGMERGVYADFPKRESLIPLIRIQDSNIIANKLSGSLHTDVTGGMRAKVQTLMHWIAAGHTEEGVVFSGAEPGQVERALMGQPVEGTYFRK